MSADRPPSGGGPPLGLMAVGSEMAGATILGVLLDVFAFNSLPWCTIGLTILGFLAAFFHLVRSAQASAARSARRPGGGPPDGPPRAP